MAGASRRQHGAVVLGLHASSDRPKGVSRGQYWLGFFLSLGAAMLYGLVLPLVELTYKRAAGGERVVTYALVVEMQLVMGFFATAFCTADTAPPSGAWPAWSMPVEHLSGILTSAVCGETAGKV
ncbi:hypothetical protein ACQ4PT_040460 [Festuca glaucescens]